MNKRKRLEQLLKESMTDKHILTSVVGICAEIIEHVWPDETELGAMYTVGDVRKIEGFYTFDWLIDDMIQALIGRHMRLIALNILNMDVDDPKLIVDVFMPVLKATNAQQIRCRKPVKDALIKMYGHPAKVDIAAMQALQRRHEAYMKSLFNPK